MHRLRLSATALLVGSTCVLAGCGSSGIKSNGSSSVASSSGAVTSSSQSTTIARTGSSPSVVRTTATAAQTATSTRTSSAPAFTHPESGQKALAAAVATVRSEGYTPNDLSEYDPAHTLRVLTATRSGTTGASDERAFFFVQERFIGTDASQPSASLKVVSQGEASVTLGYGMYRNGDSPCCPSGGQATVRFELNDGRLQATDPIPPAHSTDGLARL